MFPQLMQSKELEDGQSNKSCGSATEAQSSIHHSADTEKLQFTEPKERQPGHGSEVDEVVSQPRPPTISDIQTYVNQHCLLNILWAGSQKYHPKELDHHSSSFTANANRSSHVDCLEHFAFTGRDKSVK